MGKQWKPDPDVSLDPNERVGRRIFDEPKLKGVDKQPDFGSVRVEHFREKRGSHVSIDRLGRTNIESRVVKYLGPRCEWQGQKFNKPKSFDGWAVIQVKNLVNKRSGMSPWKVFPSAIGLENGEEYSDNMYHAHTICHGKYSNEEKALFFRYLFEQYGEFKSFSKGKKSFSHFYAIPQTLRNVWDSIRVSLQKRK